MNTDRNELILSVAVEGFWDWDLKTDRAYLSSRYCALAGYSPVDTIFDSHFFKMIIHPDDRDHVFTIIEEHLRGTRDISVIEYRMISKDGTIRWIEGRGKIVEYDEQGFPARMVGTILDVTERKRAEEAITNSNKLLQTIINTAPMRVFWKDTESRYMGCNFAFARDAGVTHPDDLIGKDDYQLVWKDHAESYRADDRSVIESGVAKLSYNERQITPDGSHAWFRTSKVPLRNEANETIGVLGIYEDITDLKQTETANARFLLRQRAILDNLPMMAWLKDTESHLEMVNEPYARNCGHSIEECIGKTDFELFPREMAESYIAGDREVISTGQKKQGEALITTPIGIRWHLYYKTPLFDEQGRVVGTTGIAQDITERKEAEEERAKLEAQLQQAQKLESVGRLAGGVAHDFNNLLTAILGNAQMGLQRSDPTQPLHAYLTEIKKAAERSADLTRQLLAFARKQTIAPRILNLNETVAGMLMMLQRLIGEDIDLNWQPEKDLWLVKVDPSQVDQILANLCINARDAISGIGKMTIETGNRSFDENYCARHVGFAPGEYVLLAVSDNGCGMDKETLALIFEPFFTTKGVGEGTGLGLATVYGIVEQNNGFIDVCSEPGLGTTFRIYLPRYMGEAEQLRPEGMSEPFLRGHETILLVEDEPAILDITTQILEEQGYTVLTANRPAEAIRLAQEHAGEIHLLMTDVIMPEMNGRDLASKLISLYPHLKCLFMSGYTSNVIAHHGVLDKNVHFTQKPFSMQSLATKVREALDSR